jgi:outer membrane protein OmpA-like peptidoglycan-associated protein
MTTLVALGAGVLLFPALVQAQFGGLGGRIQRRVENEVGRKAENTVANAVRCTLGDTKCINDAKAKNQEVVVVDKDGKPVPNVNTAGAPAGTAESKEQPGEGVWRNYDFVPGRRVLFASDFSQERVGRFPASQLEFQSGNAQIVERNGERVLEMSAATVFRVKLPEMLRDGYSIEFSYLLPAPNMSLNVFVGSPQTAVSRWPSHYMSVYHTPGLYKGGTSVSSASAKDIVGNMTDFKFQNDGNYAVFYAGPERTGNLPNVTIEPSNVVEFHVTANPNFRAYLTNIVIAAGLDPLYETLLRDKSYTTRGILFDIDQATLRPESTPELMRIEEVLQRNANLRLIIEGHTDNTGTDSHNQDLSQRRAEAVVNYLTGKGIGKDRLEAMGKGSSSPAAPNDTPQGRAQNRRVVIVLKEA